MNCFAKDLLLCKYALTAVRGLSLLCIISYCIHNALEIKNMQSFFFLVFTFIMHLNYDIIRLDCKRKYQFD